jgi:uncharacterized membrane protein YphA (DoxX/SURF4 family)
MGWFPRLSAAVLAGTLVPTTLAGHRYWEIEDKQEREPAADPLPEEPHHAGRAADRGGRYRR